jgi:hypothetical protein
MSPKRCGALQQGIWETSMPSRFAAILTIAAVLPAVTDAAERHSAPSLRALVDPSGTHRWELQWDSVSLYDAATSQFIRRFALGGAAQSSSRDFCPPDIVADGSGGAYVTSNVQPVLWRVQPATGLVVRHDLAVDSDGAKDFGFIALDRSADGVTLYGVSSNDGATWLLDPRARTASKIVPPVRVDRDCGR